MTRKNSFNLKPITKLLNRIESDLPKRRRKAARRAGRRPSGPPTAPGTKLHCDMYAMALAHPFSREAQGARVPEPYAQATTTYMYKRVVTLTSSAGGGVDFALFPHLSFVAAQFVGTSSGLTNSTPANAPAGVVCYSSGANLGAVFRSYRVVSFGLRIKSNTTFNNTTGRLYVARVPAAVDYPGHIVATGTTLTEFADMMNVPIDGTGVTSSIIALPKSEQFTISELHQESGVELVTHPISPGALDFLDGVLQQRESQTGAVVQYQDGFFSGRGWQQFLIAGDGLPASAQILTLELVYHIEGTPLVTSSTGAAMIPSGMVAAVASPHELPAIHAAVSQLPVAQKLREKARDEIRHRAEGVVRRGAASAGRYLVNKMKQSSRGELAADLLGVAL